MPVHGQRLILNRPYKKASPFDSGSLHCSALINANFLLMRQAP
jgi:hypothetical protein